MDNPLTKNYLNNEILQDMEDKVVKIEIPESIRIEAQINIKEMMLKCNISQSKAFGILFTSITKDKKKCKKISDEYVKKYIESLKVPL